MLSDKPKLIFSDIGGKVTLETRLDELRINWESTYKDTLQELKENMEWNKDEE